MRSSRNVCKKSILVMVVGLGVLASSQSAWALSASLTDMNSEAQLSDSGTIGWEVNGINHMAQQWFWLRVGDTGPERMVNKDNFTEVYTVTFPVPAFGMVSNYYDPQTMLDITVLETLMGGMPGQQWSDIAQTVRLNNHGPASLEVHLFQFVNLDLGGTPEGDSAMLRAPHVLWQGQSGATGLPGGKRAMVEMSVLSAPDKIQLGQADELLAMLNDGNPTDLVDNYHASGDDVAWALQWDLTLPPMGTVIVSEDLLMHPAPEPATMLTVGLCLVGIGRYGRRRRRRVAERHETSGRQWGPPCNTR